jgi:hypothetical protein
MSIPLIQRKPISVVIADKTSVWFKHQIDGKYATEPFLSIDQIDAIIHSCSDLQDVCLHINRCGPLVNRETAKLLAKAANKNAHCMSQPDLGDTTNWTIREHWPTPLDKEDYCRFGLEITE